MFLQKQPKTCIHSFRIRLSDLIRRIKNLNMDEKVLHHMIDPISNEIHQKYERDLFDSPSPHIRSMMNKWKECDSNDCRSNLLLLDENSSEVQKLLDKNNDFITFLNKNPNIADPWNRALLLADRIKLENDRRNLGLDLKEALKCLTRVLAEFKRTDILTKAFPGPVETYTTNFSDTTRCKNSEDVISLNPWNEIKDHTKIIIFPEGKKDTGFCYLLPDLLNSLANTVVFHWIVDKKRPEWIGQADYDIPYFKLPYPAYFIDLSGFITLLNFPHPQRPLESLPGFFQLKKLGQDRVGTQFGVSNLHGAQEDIYTIEQVQPEEKKEKKKEEKTLAQKWCFEQIQSLVDWVWNVTNSNNIEITDQKTNEKVTSNYTRMKIILEDKYFVPEESTASMIALNTHSWFEFQRNIRGFKATLDSKQVLDRVCTAAQAGTKILLEIPFAPNNPRRLEVNENTLYKVSLPNHGKSVKGFKFYQGGKYENDVLLRSFIFPVLDLFE